jgi:hypothetical protein
MSLGYMQMVHTAQAAGPSSTAVGPATLLPGAALYTFAPDTFDDLGHMLIIEASGRISNVVTSQPTFKFSVFFGATSIFDTGAILTSTTAHTTVPWYLRIMLTLRANGATANFMGQGIVASRAFIDLGATTDITTSGHPFLLGPEGTPTVGANFDSSASQKVDLQYTLSVATAGNLIQLEQYSLIDCN